MRFLNPPSMADPGIMEDDESHKMALGPAGWLVYQAVRGLPGYLQISEIFGQ